jgi:hypothetical protein
VWVDGVHILGLLASLAACFGRCFCLVIFAYICVGLY